MKHLQEIVEAAQARGKKRLAVAYGQDSHTIEAVYDAYKEGLVDPILFGDQQVIERICGVTACAGEEQCGDDEQAHRFFECLSHKYPLFVGMFSGCATARR